MKGIAVLIVVLFSISMIPVTYAESDIEIISNQYIIKIDDDKNVKEVAERVVKDLEEKYARDIEILDIYEKLGIVVIEFKPTFGISSMSNYSIKHSDIELAVNNIKVKALQQIIPTGVDRIDVDKRLALGTGISVAGGVAVLDTGIDLDHPDLNVNAISKDCVSWDGKDSVDDDNGHGTHVAGIIGAKDNGIGVVGVAPNATLYAVKVLDANGDGTLGSILCGINWVTDSVINGTDIDVANMSFGGYCPTSEPLCVIVDLIIRNSLLTSLSEGVVYVAAAGNDASDAIDYWPARFDEVITVSAVYDGDGKCGSQLSDDRFAFFSNFGSSVDIAAPGVNILSTYPDNNYAILSGTSMAAPHVSGAVVLYKMNNPLATVDEIRDAIFSNSIPQNWSCDTSKNNGYGGFTNDPDNFNEPLLYVAGDTWINDIQEIMLGESVECKSYTDLEHLIDSVECELIDPANNVIDALTTDIGILATITPDNCGDAGDCIVFTNLFDTNTPNIPGDWIIRAKFLDANNNIIAIKDKSIRVDSFFVLPEAMFGSIAVVGSVLGILYLYAKRR